MTTATTHETSTGSTTLYPTAKHVIFFKVLLVLILTGLIGKGADRGFLKGGTHSTHIFSNLTVAEYPEGIIGTGNAEISIDFDDFDSRGIAKIIDQG